LAEPLLERADPLRGVLEATAQGLHLLLERPDLLLEGHVPTLRRDLAILVVLGDGTHLLARSMQSPHLRRCRCGSCIEDPVRTLHRCTAAAAPFPVKVWTHPARESFFRDCRVNPAVR